MAELEAGFQGCLPLRIIPSLLPHQFLSPSSFFILRPQTGKFSGSCMKCVECDVLSWNEMGFILVARALSALGGKVTMLL